MFLIHFQSFNSLILLPVGRELLLSNLDVW